jgi:hypothetical protein
MLVLLVAVEIEARSQDEQARHQDEQASPPAVKTRTCVHNDYEDLL